MNIDQLFLGEHKETPPKQYIVVEILDYQGGIGGYKIMDLEEAQLIASDENREPLEDRTLNNLKGSNMRMDGEVIDLDGNIIPDGIPEYWRQIDDPMSKEQAEDLRNVLDRSLPTRMTYEEYNAKWNRKQL